MFNMIHCLSRTFCRHDSLRRRDRHW